MLLAVQEAGQCGQDPWSPEGGDRTEEELGF